MRYFRIGRLEFWVSKPLIFDFGYSRAHCRCHILSLGIIGITWLAGECLEES